MINLILTFILILCLLAAVLWKAGTCKNTDTFFDKDHTSTLKGISSIIVIFVHIPAYYQNPLQDMVGSFAYVAVTCFFMISAYGMQYSLDRNRSYLRTFPVNRLAALLIPNIFINIVTFAVYWLIGLFIPLALGFELKWSLLWRINSYVVILLEYCLVFYIVNLLSARFRWKWYINDILLIAWVCASSLFLYITESEHSDNSAQMGWCYERLGLVWGLLLYRYFPRVKTWLTRRLTMKIIIFTLSSLLLGILYLKYKEVWFYGQYMLKIVLGLSIIVFYFLITIRLRLFNPVTKFLGNISYETYLSHGFIATLLIAIFPGLPSGVFICGAVGITLLFSYLIHQLDRPAVTYVKNLMRK